MGGPYDGLVAAVVDRLGRNVVDCLNTGYEMRDEEKLLVAYGHIWSRWLVGLERLHRLPGAGWQRCRTHYAGS